MENTLTLYELNNLIRQQIEESFPFYYWVIAEISEIRENPQTRHCHLELIEKDQTEDKIIARARANIWKDQYQRIKNFFEQTTNTQIKKGLKILFNAGVEFHEVYGYSLNIFAIDPSYTVGELARSRQKIIERLKTEGIFGLNKQLAFPLVPQRIAIISSPTSAGYEDFIRQLADNPYNYKFFCRLFSAIMQGEEAPKSIIQALEQISALSNAGMNFDVVTIIRGGGSQADLSCFDDYHVACHIAQFPLPILTGIGHERDDTVTDMVSFMKLKTPTAVAEFLIDKLHQFDKNLSEYKNHLTLIFNNALQENNDYLDELYNELKISTNQIFANRKSELAFIIQRFLNVTNILLQSRQNQNNNLKNRLIMSVKNFFTTNYNKLIYFEQTVNYLKPENILRKGYSITTHKGQVIKEVFMLKEDDIIETTLYRGKIVSKVERTI